MSEFTLKALLKLDKSNFDTNTKAASNSIRSMGSLIAGAAFSGAIALGVKSAISDFSEFENKMKAVQTLLDGDAREAIVGFTNDILEMTTRIPVTADDLASSLFDVVSAGVGAGEAMSFLEEAGKLAVAGVTDTKTAVDGMTSAYNAFSSEGLTASEISDRFFAAQKEGKTTIAELSSSIGKVAPIAASMNMKLSDTLGVIAQLTTKGIRTSEAVTGIKAAISNIIKPTKEATEAAAKYGIQFDEAAVKTNGLDGVLKQVKEQVDKGNISYSQMFGSVEALNTVTALAQDNFEGLNDKQEKIANSTGIANEKFQEQSESLANQTILLTNNINKIKMQMVESFLPAILSVSSGLLSLFDSDAMSNWVMNAMLGFTNVKANMALVGVAIGGVIDSFKGLSTTGELMGIELAANAKIAALKVKNFWTDTTDEQEAVLTAFHAKKEELERGVVEKHAARAASVLEIENNRVDESILIEKRFSASSKAEVDSQLEQKKSNLDDTKTATKAALITDPDSLLSIGRFITTMEYQENNNQLNLKKDMLGNLKTASKKALLTDSDSLIETSKSLTKKEQDELDAQKKAYDKHLGDLTTAGNNFATNFQAGISSIVDMAINGSGGMVENVQGAITGLVGPDVAAFMSGAFGGVISTGIMNIVNGIFGSSKTKTVAQYAEESFKKMVYNTNVMLSDIGRQKSDVEKEINILEALESLGKTTVEGQYATLLGVSPGMAIKSVMRGKLEQLGGYESEELGIHADEIRRQESLVSGSRIEYDAALELLRRWNDPNDAFLDYGGKGVGSGLTDAVILNTVDYYKTKLEGYEAALNKYKSENLTQATLDEALAQLNIESRIQDIEMLADGGSFVVNQPTMLTRNVMAGESGPERVTVEPLNNSGMSAGATIIINAENQNPIQIANAVKSVLDDPFFSTSKGVNQAV